MISKVILFILFTCSTLWGSIICDMDTTQAFKCRFSYRQHNRILLEGGRISKLIYPEDKLFVRMEELSGHVFVQSKSCKPENLLISVVTSDGSVQDLEISFEDCFSDVIVLRPPGRYAPENLNRPLVEAPHCFQTMFNSIIEDVTHKRIPEGYCSVPFKRSIWNPKSGITAKLVGKLSGNDEDILVYQLISTTPWKKRVHERQLADANTLWAYIDQPCLKGKQGTIAIVAQRHE